VPLVAEIGPAVATRAAFAAAWERQRMGSSSDTYGLSRGTLGRLAFGWLA